MKTIERQANLKLQADSWAKKDSELLIAHIIKRYHDYLRRQLPRLSQLLEEVALTHGNSHPELSELKGLYERFRKDIEEHRHKEETVFYPLCRFLKEAACRSRHEKERLEHDAGELVEEHGQVESALARMRELTHGYKVPPDASQSYRELLAGLSELKADTHEHIYMENTVLFPKVCAGE